jgi:hypothetical protein
MYAQGESSIAYLSLQHLLPIQPMWVPYHSVKAATGIVVPATLTWNDTTNKEGHQPQEITLLENCKVIFRNEKDIYSEPHGQWKFWAEPNGSIYLRVHFHCTGNYGMDNGWGKDISFVHRPRPWASPVSPPPHGPCLDFVNVYPVCDYFKGTYVKSGTLNLEYKFPGEEAPMTKRVKH